MTTYTIQTQNGGRLCFRADLRRAGAPVLFVDDAGREVPTGLESSDCRHSARIAAAMVVGWGRARGAGLPKGAVWTLTQGENQ